MKKNFYLTKIFLILPLAIAAVWLAGAVFRGSLFHEQSPADTVCHDPAFPNQPPFSGERSDEHHGFLQVVLPANGASAAFSRRNYEPSPQRFLRNSDIGVITGKTILATVIFRFEKRYTEHLFFFQSFIRHSLPERAGPLKA